MKKLLIVWLVVGCASDDVAVATSTQPALAANALAANALATNALAANALAANALAANALAANALAANGLISGPVSDPAVALALEDPDARTYLRYLVECALRSDQEVTFASRATGAAKIPAFRGKLGLCPAWQTGAPDQGCRERVSACLLARNNAFGVSVPFSLRGQRADPDPVTLVPQPLPLADAVPAHDRLPGTNSVARSLSRCVQSSPFTSPEDRDCGWAVDHVGVCQRGQMVVIGAGALATCWGEPLGTASTGDEMLRVCAGPSACDSRSPTLIASANDPCGDPAPMIEFPCPASGVYAVMKGTASNRQPSEPGTVGSDRIAAPRCNEMVAEELAACASAWTADCEARAETLCRYPASEQHAFRWREGAFYGDLFGAANRNPKQAQLRVHEVAPGTFQLESAAPSESEVLEWRPDNGALAHGFTGLVYPSMYACSSRNWTQPAAYMALRICAGPNPSTTQCAATYAGPCAKICKTEPAGPRGEPDVNRCTNGLTGQAWRRPLMTFLAQPCDLVSGACGTVASDPILAW